MGARGSCVTLGRAVVPVLGDAARSGGRRAEQGRRMWRRTDGGHGSVIAQHARVWHVQRVARAVTGARAAARRRRARFCRGATVSWRRRCGGRAPARATRTPSASGSPRAWPRWRRRWAANASARLPPRPPPPRRRAARAVRAADAATPPWRLLGPRAGRLCSRGSGRMSVAPRASNRHGWGPRRATTCRGRAQVEAAEADAEAARREAAAAAAAARREAAEAAAAARAATERGDSAALAAALEREAAAAAGLADLRAEFQARAGPAAPAWGRAGGPAPCSLWPGPPVAGDKPVRRVC